MEGLEGTKHIDQDWPFSPSFLYLRRFRLKDEVWGSGGIKR